MNFNIIQGDNRDTLKTIADNSIDAIITDPPYGIDFLGKSWDANTGALDTYQECLRVLKPGGYLLAFSAARTYHHLAITLEVAGFEIRDQIMWLYSSGFPKAQDIGKAIQKRIGVEETKPTKGMNGYAEVKNKKGKEKWMNPGNISSEDYPDKKNEVVCTSPKAKQWEGWKTALKPGHEPICMARKPFKGSTIDNVLAHGVGGLNIDATRIALEENGRTSSTPNHIQSNSFDTMNIDQQKKFTWTGDPVGFVPNELGRYPSNVLGEIPDYQKYFYCPKVSRGERHVGFDLEIDRANMVEIMGGYWCDDQGTPGTDGKSVWLPHTGLIYAHGLTQVYNEWCKNNNRDTGNVGNNHPTVKPLALMKYLVKLVSREGQTVLDPFMGSGTTGIACKELGREFIGIEMSEEYIKIAEKRIGSTQENLL
jgi:site-specific DNA-methyltransferase (adenine-specific)